MIRFTIIAATAVLSILTAAGVAEARPAEARAGDTRSVAVRYADLALGTAEGRATLDARIARAIDQVCSGADGSAFAALQAEHICRRGAEAGARARIAALIAGPAGARYAAVARPR